VGALRLHRYLATLAIRRLAIALALLAAVYAVIDLVEVQSLAAAGAGSRPLSWYPLRLPAIVAHVLPLAATLGALLALGSLRRHGEWEALLAAGVGPGRVVLGLAVGPLLAAFAMLPLVLELAPRANAGWSRAVAPPSEATGTAAEERWIAVDGQALARVARDGAGWFPKMLIELPGATHRGKRIDVDRDQRGAAVAFGEHEEPPASSGSWLAGQTLPRTRLDRAIDARRGAGLDTAALEAERALRRGLILASALLPLLGLLLAVAWGFGRASALTTLALALGVGYWLLTAVAWNGAAAGAWPAAWICPGVPTVFTTASLAAVALLRPRDRPLPASRR
jgi:lipopolysaccharide export LptBFGC system permease protein LptF